MTQDQYSAHDPTTQFAPSDALPGQQLAHPALESDMAVAPDYGEETYRGSGKLEGKRALNTRGDSGIGRAVALAYAREGADVVLSYLPEEEDDAQLTAGLVRDAGRTAVTAPATSGRSPTAGSWWRAPSPSSAGSTCCSATPPTRCRSRASRT